MAYKDGTAPQINDAVLGVIGGAPARGKVVACDKTGEKITIARYGEAVLHEKSGQMTQGKLEHVPAAAEDFELLHRPKPKKAPAPAAAVAKEA